MSELLKRLKKNSKLERVNVLSESDFFDGVAPIPTDIPILNVALGGSLNGGVTPGVTLWAGPSKHFKTSFMLVCLKAFLDSSPDAIGIWFDSEFGSPSSYFKSFGIDPDKILHVPITNLEELKFELMNQLGEIKRGDKVMLCIDSLGNLASKKEVEDAINEKSVADMTRAKQTKSLFRMVTPVLKMKELCLMAIQHTYDSMSLYPTRIVGGGTGGYYASDQIFIIGRQQEKDADGIAGYNFVVNVEKSRSVREKKKFSINVLYDKGINKWSGLLDLAMEAKFVVKPKNGWYAKCDPDTGEVDPKNLRESQLNTKEFWEPILKDPRFNKWVIENYQVSATTMITDDILDTEVDSIDDVDFDDSSVVSL